MVTLSPRREKASICVLSDMWVPTKAEEKMFGSARFQNELG